MVTHKMSDEEFAAWCEWRKWCSVWRVKDPQPTEEELAAGKRDDKTPEERECYYQYLSGYVTGSLSKWLRRWYQTNKENSSVRANQKDELISIFDDFMKSPKKEAYEGFTGASYKDFIFYQISESADPPGKILNGKIFGKAGYIREIATRYLAETEQLDQGPRGGLLLKPGTRSMDAILEGTEDLTLQDVLNIQADKTDTPDDTEAVKSLKTKLNPTREEKLALWAKAHGVAISNPALCKVLHCAKEKADHILEGVFRRLRNETPELLDENNLHILLFLIYQDLESEKEASSFLYGIVGQEEGDC